MFLKTSRHFGMVIVIQRFDYNNCYFVYWLYENLFTFGRSSKQNKKNLINKICFLNKHNKIEYSVKLKAVDENL